MTCCYYIKQDSDTRKTYLRQAGGRSNDTRIRNARRSEHDPRWRDRLVHCIGAAFCIIIPTACECHPLPGAVCSCSPTVAVCLPLQLLTPPLVSPSTDSGIERGSP